MCITRVSEMVVYLLKNGLLVKWPRNTLCVIKVTILIHVSR